MSSNASGRSPSRPRCGWRVTVRSVGWSCAASPKSSTSAAKNASSPLRCGARLVARDRGCAWPGCDRPAVWCDAHHIIWWEHDGPTNQENCCLLCRRHHVLCHEGGWGIKRADDGTYEIQEPPADPHRRPATRTRTTHRPPDPPGRREPSPLHCRTRCEPRNGLWRSLVSALVWGTKGPGFKSRQPDRERAVRGGTTPAVMDDGRSEVGDPLTKRRRPGPIVPAGPARVATEASGRERRSRCSQ